MLSCKVTGESQIWQLVKEVWGWRNSSTWLKMNNIGSVIRFTLTNFKTQKRIPKLGDNHLFKILIAKSLMLIWYLRNQRICGHTTENTWPTEEDMRARWIVKINVRLTIDRASTHNKFGPLTTKKDLVLKTWSGTLKNEHTLPDD